MTTGSQTATFYVEENQGATGCRQETKEAPTPSPSIPIPRRRNLDSAGENEAVFSTSVSEPQLLHRSPLRTRIDRIHSAPTLMEHEVGLMLRSISDEFNERYSQLNRRASHPGINNHHSPGFLDRLRRPFSRRSWSNAPTNDALAAEEESAHGTNLYQRESTRLSQRESVQSVTEEDEEYEYDEMADGSELSLYD